MKLVLIGLLTIGALSAFARTKELHTCSAICVERINLIPGNWQTLPVSGQAKSVVVSSLGKTRNEAVDRLLNKCRKFFNSFSAEIAGGITYYESYKANGNEVVGSHVASPFAGETTPFGETSNLNCDSLKL